MLIMGTKANVMTLIIGLTNC